MQKSPAGYYVVVEVVGGRHNPNVIPAMILRFSEAKWNDMIYSGVTLGEILYENDTELRKTLDIDFNKKNRVIAAQFASSEAIANTPHSPRYNTIIHDNIGNSNPSEENSFKKADEPRYALSDESYLAAAESGDIEAAQRMVDEAAKATMPNPLIRDDEDTLTSNQFKSADPITYDDESEIIPLFKRFDTSERAKGG